MNLRILDAKKDYLGISSKFPNNFYVVLAEKAVRWFRPDTKENRLSTTLKVLGNLVDLVVGPKELSLTVDGKKYATSEVSISGLEKLIYRVFQDDLYKNINIVRPENRDILKDRKEFNRIPKTVFTSLYKDVAYNEEGSKNVDVLNSRSKALVMSETQYENASKVDSFKRDNFRKVSVGGDSIFVNKSVDVIKDDDISNGDVKANFKMLEDILTHRITDIGWWARNNSLDRLSTNVENFVNTLFVYKERAWLIKPLSMYEYEVQLIK